jgi:hypothetical protein
MKNKAPMIRMALELLSGFTFVVEADRLEVFVIFFLIMDTNFWSIKEVFGFVVRFGSCGHFNRREKSPSNFIMIFLMKIPHKVG